MLVRLGEAIWGANSPVPMQCEFPPYHFFQRAHGTNSMTDQGISRWCRAFQIGWLWRCGNLVAEFRWRSIGFVPHAAAHELSWSHSVALWMGEGAVAVVHRRSLRPLGQGGGSRFSAQIPLPPSQ